MSRRGARVTVDLAHGAHGIRRVNGQRQPASRQVNDLEIQVKRRITSLRLLLPQGGNCHKGTGVN